MKAFLVWVGLAIVMCVSPLAGAEDLSGTWKGSFDLHGNTLPAVINLKVAGTDVTGTVVLPTGPPSDIREGKVDGENVTFWMNSDYQGTTYKIVFKGKVAGDHIDFSFGTDNGSWSTTMTVKKELAAAATPAPVPEPPKPLDLTGVWKGTFDANGTNMSISINLKSSGNVVTGTVEGAGAPPIEIHDGKIDGNVVTFWLNADYQGQTYAVTYKGNAAADHIDFSFGTADGAWSTTVTVKK
jgi:hypothetical protein